jgi:hypothetical protein
MSNFIIRQEGPSSVVADNLWEIRLGVGSFLVGALVSALAMVAVGLGGQLRPQGRSQDRPREYP